MTDWRLAKSLITLQGEVNYAHPDRPRQSDGTIGDPRHQAEQSDHNPLPPHTGVVTAWDITSAPFTIALAEQLRQMGPHDGRVKYVIYRGRITSAQHGWQWAPYSGYSQHFDHIHLSVSDDPAQYDRTDPWLTVHAHTVSKPTPVTLMEDDMPVIAITESHKHWLTDLLTTKAPITGTDEAKLLEAGIRKVGMTDAFLANVPTRAAK